MRNSGNKGMEDFNRAERFNVIYQMVEHLDAQARKQFFKSMLPIVLNDKEFVSNTFIDGCGKSSAPKDRLTEEELQMINQIADSMKEVQCLVDLDELLNNP
jgi:hypothetical protein